MNHELILPPSKTAPLFALIGDWTHGRKEATETSMRADLAKIVGEGVANKLPTPAAINVVVRECIRPYLLLDIEHPVIPGDVLGAPGRWPKRLAKAGDPVFDSFSWVMVKKDLSPDRRFDLGTTGPGAAYLGHPYHYERDRPATAQEAFERICGGDGRGWLFVEDNWLIFTNGEKEHYRVKYDG